MAYDFIENYGLIGDCHGCALVSKSGGIRWLTFRRFDAQPLLWAMLDDEKGAALSVKLPAAFTWSSHYQENTNILITEAISSETIIRFTDFMPVGRSPQSTTHDYTSLEALHGLVRKIELFGEDTELRVLQCKNPWPGSSAKLYVQTGAEDGFQEQTEDSFTISLKAERPYFIVLSEDYFLRLSRQQLERLQEVTENFWREWIDYCQYTGENRELIVRSALTLKMLIHAQSGAIIAAPTTSLPEKLRGERNWDYRYSWLRDSAFTLYALGYLGFSGEADKYADFIRRLILKSPRDQLRVLYNLDGESNIPEVEIPIKGYQGSTPVRVGNGAHDQVQLDTYGEFLDWAYLHRALGGKLDDVFLEKIRETAEYVKANWKCKDRGIWEVRSEPEDFTYSKVMCWVALDRAGSLLGNLELYGGTKSEIEEYINSNCIENGLLKRSAQSSELDASLLLLKTVGYPIPEHIYRATVYAIAKELGKGPFIKRYLSHDGLKDVEGHFLICSFWMVNAYLFLGEDVKATVVFNELLKCVSELGLLSEEVDVDTFHFLGNYPQALTHLAQIETASYFDLYSRGGKEALEGCHGDRVRKLHKTLHGPKAVIDFIIHTRNFKKLVPSNQSILRWSQESP